MNFADMDLLAAGPAVQDLSRSFDEFWNSEWAFPIEALRAADADPSALQKVREVLAAHRSAAQDSDYAKRLRGSDLLKRLERHDLPLVWAPARVVYDRPEEAGGEGQPADHLKLGPQLKAAVAEPRSDFLISSPYFIPGERGVASFKQLREKGVRIRIVTNYFAGNDVALVHSGYARYRKDLLKLGVELYELKPFDNGWNSELAVDNIKKSLDRLEIDLYTYVLDRDEIRNLQLAFLKASVPNAEIPTDHAIVALHFKVAAEQGRKYIFNGGNIATEAFIQKAWAYDARDRRHLRAIQRRFGTITLNTFPTIGIPHYLYSVIIKGIRWITILNYMAISNPKRRISSHQK